MSEMVERVARAICAAGHFDPDSLLEGQLGYAGTGDRKFWTVFEPQARAAIEAMREPTEGMIRAGGEFEVPNGWHNDKIDTYAAEGAWLNMINAALK